MDKMQPIGVLDSGVGGLSVLKCLHQMLPYEDLFMWVILHVRLTAHAVNKKSVVL